MLVAALLFLGVHALLALRIVARRRAERPEAGTFAGLAAEIEALGRDAAPEAKSVEDEWTWVKLAA